MVHDSAGFSLSNAVVLSKSLEALVALKLLVSFISHLYLVL